jgi:phosphodiesterase/alkaline phosphatase D-like protein
MPEPTRRATAGRAGLVAATILVTLAASASPAHAFASQLRRYPYLTDAEDTGTTVNWGTDRTLTSASVKWGGPGESCTAHAAAASRTSITVNGVAEYQWKARITGLQPDTRYCYRVFGGTTDLLGTDASPSFSSPIAAGATTPFSFAVFGDWGLASSTGNPGQAAVLSGIARSGARFAVTTGDTGYPSGSQTNYGDLTQTGANISAVFGPSFWTIPGTSIPLFSALGNHGVTTTFLQNWPEGSAAAASGGRFQAETYC